MVATRQNRGVESKARLFQAASHIFAERGYYGTKVSDIVAEAGVSQPTFYAYFDSKEALFAELVATFREGLSTFVVISRVPEDSTPETGERHLRDNLTAIFEYLGSDPVMTRIGLLLAPDSAEIYGALAAIVTTNLTRAQILGWARPSIEVSVVAEAIVGVIHQLTVRYLLTRERDPLQLADIAVDFILQGTQKPIPPQAVAEM